MRFPSGAKAIEYMRPRWPSTLARRRPVAESQSRSVPSWPQEASVLPSGANATDVTVFSWRSRRVPMRMTARAGSGSPSTSTGSCRAARIRRLRALSTVQLSYTRGIGILSDWLSENSRRALRTARGLFHVADDDLRLRLRDDVVFADLGGDQVGLALLERLRG